MQISLAFVIAAVAGMAIAVLLARLSAFKETPEGASFAEAMGKARPIRLTIGFLVLPLVAGMAAWSFPATDAVVAGLANPGARALLFFAIVSLFLIPLSVTSLLFYGFSPKRLPVWLSLAVSICLGFWVWAGTTLLNLKVPENGFVAQDGVVLKPGTSYSLIPGFKSRTIGFSKESYVGNPGWPFRLVVKATDGQGCDAMIVTNVTHDLKPGDRIDPRYTRDALKDQLENWLTPAIRKAVGSPKVCNTPREVTYKGNVEPQDQAFYGIQTHWGGSIEYWFKSHN